MYYALYRKWRPQNFSDVIGQDSIIQTLKNQVSNNKLSHAYLFTGFRGTGKTTCAKILSKAVNCPNQKDGNPCNNCDICRGIDNGSIMDILEIDAASNNGVENIRELREEANFTPSVCKYRIYIIDEVHMLSIGAFNALLKIMEEPPSYVIFILATTEIHKIPATILSRCQQFYFNKIEKSLIAERLMFVAKSENIKLHQDAADVIAKYSHGGLRDALSILDACVSFSSEEDIDKSIVSKILSVSDISSIIDLARFILEKNASNSLELIKNLTSKYMDPLKLSSDLIDIFKNILVLKTTENENSIDMDSDSLSALLELCKNHELSHIINVLDILSLRHDNIARSAFKQSEFEITVIKAIFELPSDQKTPAQNLGVTDLSKLNQKITFLESEIIRLKDTINILSKTPKTKQSENTSSEIFSKEEIDSSLYEDCEELENWGEILSFLSTINPSICAALKDSKGHINNKAEIIFIETQSQFFLELIRSSTQAKQSLKQAIFKVLGKKYRIGPYKNFTKEPKYDIIKDIEETAKKNNINIDIV